ncbi:MAG TPA: hypothetical protein DCW90_15735 [Lachnospiraceae bacterium]|nr:hypothetical protein [uncultured Lachnoclostridium sp.]HAU86881.1 hypothetical protein [Lachnospiraceae bacterium]
MIDLLGLKLEHPVIVSAGPMGESKDSIQLMFQHGAAAVVTKTIAGIESKHNNIYSDGDMLFNKDGYSRKSTEEWYAYLKQNKESNVIPNIYGDTGERIIDIGTNVVSAGGKLLEICLSCGTRDQQPICFQVDYLQELCKKVRKAIDIPIVIKLMISNSSELNISMVKAIYESGIDGVSLSDSLPGIVLDKNSKKMFGGSGGVSGKFMKPLVLKALYDIRNIPITKIAYGGVYGGKDIDDYINYGATAVGVCSAILQNGNSKLTQIRDSYLEIQRGRNNVKI